MEYLQLAFTVVLLLFWVRLWSAPANEFYFNPFLSGTVRLTDVVFAYLRPVLNLPERGACLILLFAVFTFKTLLAGRFGFTWTFTIGSTYIFTSPSVAGVWKPHFLFSALHAVLFLVRLWSVYFIVRLISDRGRNTRATEAFAYFARPFSRLPLLAQPVMLLAINVALAFLLARHASLGTASLTGRTAVAVSDSPFVTGPLIVQTLKTAWLAALSCADGLALLTRALLFAIIGNFGAAILQAHGAALICHEAVELLLGRFARNRAAAAGLDFTPLLFFFVVNVLYSGLCSRLAAMIESSFF